MLDHDHCKEYLSQFSDYIDGELSPELCASLEAHMRDCDNCRIVVNTLHKTIDLYHTFPQENTLPENVRSRLFARLKLDESTDRE